MAQSGETRWRRRANVKTCAACLKAELALRGEGEIDGGTRTGSILCMHFENDKNNQETRA